MKSAVSAFLRQQRLPHRGIQCCLLSSKSGESSTVAFDRSIKKIQRDNAARAHQLWEDRDRVDYDYFREEIARRLVDRLDDIRRDGFPLALDVGKFDTNNASKHRRNLNSDLLCQVPGQGTSTEPYVPKNPLMELEA
jgi:hypothetical protein